MEYHLGKTDWRSFWLNLKLTCVGEPGRIAEKGSVRSRVLAWLNGHGVILLLGFDLLRIKLCLVTLSTTRGVARRTSGLKPVTWGY